MVDENAFIEIIKIDKTKYEYEIPYNRIKTVDRLTNTYESTSYVLYSVSIITN